MNNKGIKDTLFVCLNCKSEFSFKSYSRKHKYCSTKCSSEYVYKQRIERDRELFNQGLLSNRKTIYLFLVERDGNKCSVCNITEHNGRPIRFWVDHKDGNPSNNQPDNFRLICPNCDSQGETFGAKNTGKGRKSLGLRPYN